MARRRSNDERRYRAGWVDYVREQAGCSLPQVDWREEWAREYEPRCVAYGFCQTEAKCLAAHRCTRWDQTND